MTSDVTKASRRSSPISLPTSTSTSHPVDVHVGQQIRVLRVQSRLSQTELSIEIGVSYQQMQKYESAKNRVSASMLCKIAGALKVPVERFFEGLPRHGAEGIGQSASEVDERIAYLSTPEGGQLVDSVLLLAPRVRRRLLSLVNVLVEE